MQKKTTSGFQAVQNNRFISKFDRNKDGNELQGGKMQGLKEDRTCYYCGIKEHLKAACWAWKRQNEWQMEGYKREAKNSALTLEKDNDGKEDFIGFNKEMVVDVCIEGQPARLLIDSGSEVTLIRNDFMEKVENKGKVYPGRYHTIIGVGVIIRR